MDHTTTVPAAPETRSGVVSRYATAWQEGDLATLIECYDEGIVAQYGGSSPFAGTHVGRDRFLEVLATTAALGRRSLVSIDQVNDDGNRGALFVTESFVVDGRPRTLLRALRYRVADDRIVECWLFDHDQHVIDQVWSSPDDGGSM